MARDVVGEPIHLHGWDRAICEGLSEVNSTERMHGSVKPELAEPQNLHLAEGHGIQGHSHSKMQNYILDLLKEPRRNTIDLFPRRGSTARTKKTLEK